MLTTSSLLKIRCSSSGKGSSSNEILKHGSNITSETYIMTISYQIFKYRRHHDIRAHKYD